MKLPLIGFLWTPIENFISKLSVARAICYSFGLAIFIGSFVLYFIERGNISYIDSLYMTASSFCVTGLATIPVSSLSFWGQLCLLIFIQLGGLGIVVFTMLVGMLLLQGLSRNTKFQQFITEAIDADIKENEYNFINRTILAIFNITIIIEVLGAILLYIFLPMNDDKINSVNRIFLSIFTSISAFNNAGLSIVDDLSAIKQDHVSMLIVMTLILAGGIGYPVIIFLEKLVLDIIRRFSLRLEATFETYLMQKAMEGKDPSWFHEFIIKLTFWTEDRISSYNRNLRGESSNIQMKVILLWTIFLILLGGFSLLFSEWSNPSTIGNMPLFTKIVNSFFMSISSRTAGFNTYDMTNITNSSITMIVLLMFIGGGPQGTAGGIKITTFAILVQYIRNVIATGTSLTMFGCLISKKSVAISIRLYFLATTFLSLMTFILSMVHSNQNHLHLIVFEIVSAFGTVGFSLGITPSLNMIEKLIYIAVMYIGRVGIFTIMIAITEHEGTAQLGETDDGYRIQVG